MHLFETHCAILPLFNPNIDLLRAVKVTKSGHHLSQDWASKGYGSIPCLTSQPSLHACLQRPNTMQISLWHQTRNRPMLLTSSVVWQMMARFCNFYNVKKVKTCLKRRNVFRTGAKIYLTKKIFWGYGHFKWFTQEQDMLSLVRTQTWTTQTRDEHTNQEAAWQARNNQLSNYGIYSELIDHFWFLKIQLHTIDLTTRPWGISPTSSVVILLSLVLRSIVLSCVIYIEIGPLSCKTPIWNTFLIIQHFIIWLFSCSLD